MIAAVVSEKGGTGKTTIAIHLAGWRHMTGRDVMLLDSDRQGSAGYWVEIRKREETAGTGHGGRGRHGSAEGRPRCREGVRRRGRGRGRGTGR